MKIEKIEVNWWEGYMNTPELVVYVDERLKHEEFVYQAYRSTKLAELDAAQTAVVGHSIKAHHTSVVPFEPRPGANHFFLLSTNNDPWIKFVSIANSTGRPQTDGALGGDYKLTSGEVFKSRTGWSSNSNAVNQYYKEFLPRKSEIVEVVLKDHEYKSGWGGYAICVDYLNAYSGIAFSWPKIPGTDRLVYFIRKEMNHGTYWVPSCKQHEIVKPSQMQR